MDPRRNDKRKKTSSPTEYKFDINPYVRKFHQILFKPDAMGNTPLTDCINYLEKLLNQYPNIMECFYSLFIEEKGEYTGRLFDSLQFEDEKFKISINREDLPIINFQNNCDLAILEKIKQLPSVHNFHRFSTLSKSAFIYSLDGQTIIYINKSKNRYIKIHLNSNDFELFQENFPFFSKETNIRTLSDHELPTIAEITSITHDNQLSDELMDIINELAKFEESKNYTKLISSYIVEMAIENECKSEMLTQPRKLDFDIELTQENNSSKDQIKINVEKIKELDLKNQTSTWLSFWDKVNLSDEKKIQLQKFVIQAIIFPIENLIKIKMLLIDRKKPIEQVPTKKPYLFLNFSSERDRLSLSSSDSSLSPQPSPGKHKGNNS